MNQALSISRVNDWPDVLESNRGWLESVIYARLRDRHAVDEVMQETALAASRGQMPSADVGAICRWLYAVAIRQAMLHRRQGVRHRRKLDGAAGELKCQGASSQQDGNNPLALLLASEQQDLVRRAMEKLLPRDYQVLVLKYAEGWSCREIAVRLGVSHTAMRSRLMRARKNLRTELLEMNQMQKLL